MKKVSFIVILSAFSTIIMHGQIIQTGDMTSDQLKANLLQKYQGKINGIESLARSVTDLHGITGAVIAKGMIDTAVNQFIGMGSIDIEVVENNLEKQIHESLTDIFKQSIAVANKTYIHEMSNNLFAIAPWNKKVVWNSDQTHVLMLTWIPTAYRATYDTVLQNGGEMTISWDAWVTAVPEVKEFIKNYMENNKNSFNATDRIEQFLGLIPSKPPYKTSQNKVFVQMWVRPEDLFRPCLDAEVCNTECAIDPHESDLNNLPVAFRDMTKLIPMTADHKTWFENEKKGKYAGQWAMPWTRFGYTYDWGSLKKSAGKRAAQGASEYLIKKGSKVLINNLIPTDEYATSASPISGYIYNE